MSDTNGSPSPAPPTRTIFVEVRDQSGLTEIWDPTPELMASLGWCRIGDAMTFAQGCAEAGNGNGSRGLHFGIEIPAPGEVDLITIRLDPDMSDEENAEYAEEQLSKQGLGAAKVTVTSPAPIPDLPAANGHAAKDATAAAIESGELEFFEGKLPSERIKEIAADGRAMCALADVRRDEAGIVAHAIGLYLDERFGRA